MMECGRTVLAASLVVLVGSFGCSRDRSSPRDSQGKVRVVATIFPLADVVRQIGGPLVDVHCLLGPGQTPHGFTLKTSQMEQLARAQLVVTIGMGVDQWASAAVRHTAGRRAAVLELCSPEKFRRLLERHGQGREGHEGGDDRGGRGHHHAGDPHVWLDPVFMQVFVAEIARELARIDPPHAGEYSRRADAYAARLRKLDEEYRTVLGAVRHRAIVTFHPAFTYVAGRYGLTARSIRTADAKGFGARHIEDVTAFVRAHGVRAIFTEPQFPPEKLRMLAKRTGARVGRLDPLGNPNVEGYDSYLAMMRSNLGALKRALSE